MSDNVDPRSPSDTGSPARPRNSIVSSGLSFLKLSGKTKDGQQQKKRGPKPDAKPAQNPRQARNREAQRNHRERKEKYVTNLEQEVVRLREAFTTTSKEKSGVISENRRLRDILKANGITVEDLLRLASNPPSPTKTNTTSTGLDDYDMQDDYSPSPNATGYMSSEYSHGESPEAQQISQQQGGYGRVRDGMDYGAGSTATGMESSIYGGTTGQQGINYSQIGIDFVLALEKPCMQHILALARSTIDHPSIPSPDASLTDFPPISTESNADPNHSLELDGHGHALMAICPPTTFFLKSSSGPLTPVTPDAALFHYPLKTKSEATNEIWEQTYTSNYLLPTPTQAQPATHLKTTTMTYQTPSEHPMDQADIDLLFNMQVLDAKRQQYLVDKAESELTPVAVWTWLTTRPEFPLLELKDFDELKAKLVSKVKCYGFGAVILKELLEEAWEAFLETRR